MPRNTASNVAAKTTANGGGRVKTYSPKKVDLGCGQNKPEGYFGIDYADGEGVDLVHDLLEFPWPIKSDVVEEIHCSHFIEHIPHWRPGWEKDGWFLFFDEVYRICKADAMCTFIHPYVMSTRAFWDPTHTRYIHETTWYYLNAEWRKMQALDHYPAEHDFAIDFQEGLGVDAGIAARHHEAQQFARNHYWNVFGDLIVRIKAIK